MSAERTERASRAVHSRRSLTPAAVIYGLGMGSMLTEAPKPSKPAAAAKPEAAGGGGGGASPAVGACPQTREVVVDVKSSSTSTKDTRNM